MSNPLVSAADLLELVVTSGLDRPVTILDVRYQMGGPGGPGEHAAGHIPGAAYVDLDSALADAPGPRGRHPLPPIDVFEQAMRAAGVSGDRLVVAYDDWGGRAAARAWWLLRHHGHPDVRVLDGGLAAWVRAGGDLQTGPVAPEPGSFTAAPGRLPVLDADAVLSFASTHSLIDARAPERFRGEVEPVDPVAGHVPGAVNVPTAENLRPDGTFRSPEELRRLYDAVIRNDGEVGTYCGSGVTATHDILALAIAGREATLYAGSWSEWVTDPSRPVATGPAR
jgi:thiosulfate/3-mercaptopyruvate sulfurtransferase